MPLFEVAIIQKANKKETDAGEPAEKLLMPPTPVLARDAATAALIAMTGPGAPAGIDLNRAEVNVRPFA